MNARVHVCVCTCLGTLRRLAAAKAEDEKASQCRIAIGNLPAQLESGMLKMLFESFGRVSTVPSRKPMYTPSLLVANV